MDLKGYKYQHFYLLNFYVFGGVEGLKVGGWDGLRWFSSGDAIFGMKFDHGDIFGFILLEVSWLQG